MKKEYITPTIFAVKLPELLKAPVVTSPTGEIDLYDDGREGDRSQSNFFSGTIWEEEE